jgi:hypothetical protein
MDTDIDNFNGQLTKKKSVESINFYKILRNRILSADVVNKLYKKEFFR